jgi:flagellar motor switch protein FliN/FliY
MGGIDPEVAPADLAGEDFATLTQVIQEAARGKFGAEVTCSAGERLAEAPGGWTSVALSVKQPSGADLPVHVSISPDLEAALGGSTTETAGLEEQDLMPRAFATSKSADILMHVEMPVTIVLGRTKMRLKDLLKLTNGSVVELDQVLDDEVEIRVNNCVIAYGEVVAVDGNYAVRILRMAPARDSRNLRGERPEKAA